MFGHPLELIVVLVLALIFFGPEKLPEVAASAGKFVRELRQAFDVAANPEETTLPDDFSTYYYDSVARSGDDDVAVEETPDPADSDLHSVYTGEEWHPSATNPWGRSAELDDEGVETDLDDDLDPAAHPVVSETHTEGPTPEGD